jgi:hypothetical protein
MGISIYVTFTPLQASSVQLTSSPYLPMAFPLMLASTLLLFLPKNAFLISEFV